MYKKEKISKGTNSKFFLLNIVDKKDDFLKIMNEKEKTVDFLTTKLVNCNNPLAISINIFYIRKEIT
jgi:hypothetical protein